MVFRSVIFCWPFGQHLLTKYLHYICHKNTVFGYNKASKPIGSQNMAVGGVLGFVNCSTRPNLKIVKTEIDLNPCIEFWEKSNFGHFAIFRLFFLIHFLMYFLTYFLMCFLIPVYVCIVCRSKFISQLLRMTRQFRMTPRQNHNCTNHYHQTLRNHFPTPIQIPTPILHHIQYFLSAPW